MAADRIDPNKLLDVLGIIALRKVELYSRILAKSKELNRNIDEALLKRDIARMPNERFITKEEQARKTVDPSTKFENLKFNLEDFMASK